MDFEVNNPSNWDPNVDIYQESYVALLRQELKHLAVPI